jgi:small-conductance mechanosensitive channel
MGFRGIVARSGQAFKYILDPTTEIESSYGASQVAELKQQLDEVQRKLTESESQSRAKDTLIAQLREQLAAQSHEAEPAPVKKAKTTRRRKTADKAKKPTQPRKKAKSAKPRATAKKAAPKAKRTVTPKRAPRTRES